MSVVVERGQRRSRLIARAKVMAIAGLVAAVGACSPPGATRQTEVQNQSDAPISTDVAAAGKVTLKVYDSEGVDSSRGGGVIGKKFMAKYPNVTVVRDNTDFNSYQTQAKLLLSAPDAPCVAVGNQGYSLDSTLVKAGLIRPLDAYAKAYGWSDAINGKLLDQYRLTPDGKKFGQGNLYGLGSAGEIVGWFYNKDLLAKAGVGLPTNTAEFSAALAKAKAAGIQPILLGNKEKWPASHLVLSPAMSEVDATKAAELVYADTNVHWRDLGITNAFDMARDWVQKGYIQSGFNGLPYQSAIDEFMAGDSLFLNGGSWLTGDMNKKLGNKVGFFVFPGDRGGNTQATGSLSLPHHITTSCKTPDVAAAYIDFMIRDQVQEGIFQDSDIPANLPNATYPSGTVASDVLSAFQRSSRDGTLLPYMDWSTTTIGDIGWSGLQEMLAGRISSVDLITLLDQDRDKFYQSQ